MGDCNFYVLPLQILLVMPSRTKLHLYIWFLSSPQYRDGNWCGSWWESWSLKRKESIKAWEPPFQLPRVNIVHFYTILVFSTPKKKRTVFPVTLKSVPGLCLTGSIWVLQVRGYEGYNGKVSQGMIKHAETGSFRNRVWILFQSWAKKQTKKELLEEIWKRNQEASRNINKIGQIITTHCVKMIGRTKLRDRVFN